MHSSTSNSSPAGSGGSVLAMIGAGLLFTCAYFLAIEVFRPVVSQAQNQWVMNAIRAERFVYAQNRAQVLVVGSSLAARLQDGSLGEGIYNLSFGGGSALTGLEVVGRVQVPPSLVLIESNVLDRAGDEAFTARLYHPFFYPARRYIRALRHEYQPVNLFTTAISNLYKSGTGLLDAPQKVDPRQLQGSIKAHRKNEEKFALREAFLKNVEQLQSTIRALQGKGVRVAFFELPTNAALASGHRSSGMRTHLKEIFPENRFDWIDLDAIRGDIRTTDGIHLVREDAHRAATILRRQSAVLLQ